MKELSQKRINKLCEQTIIDCKNANKSVNNYILHSIQNINSVIDENQIKSEIQYWSCSSNYWIGVNCLLQAYIERLDIKN